MSPFVVAPQTKKLAVRSQNVDEREASARPPIAARNGFCCTIGGSSTTAPNGRSPTSAGLSRRKRSDERQREGESDDGDGQSPPSASPATVTIQPSSGRKTSWPVALLAVSIPVTSPRRSTNQRFAITAASVTPIAPVARPFATPQSRSSCQGDPICVVSVELVAIVGERDHDHPADAEAVVEPGRERPAEAVEDEVDRDGGRDRRARPAELVLQRHDQHADRRAEPGGGDQRQERDTAATTQP